MMEAYSQESLTRISSVVIDAYRSKDFHFLERLAFSIRDYVSIREDQIGKLFSRLMMLYHPDRLEINRKAITQFFNQRDAEAMNRYAHVFVMLEAIDQADHRRRIIKNSGAPQQQARRRKEASLEDDDILRGEAGDFMSALKQKEYGNLDVVYRERDLVNTEGEIELAGYDIRDLSGLELCIHITALNLSDNAIYDISAVGYLELLEELDLSFNRIGHIAVLSELTYLQILDLSFNDIEDIRSLLDLEKLEYVNVIGNPVPGNQIAELREKGVLVVA